MKNVALASLLAATVALAAAPAQAQNCPPGSWLCANLQIGGGVSVTPPPPPPPPQPVMQVQTQVQTPVVVVQAEVMPPPPAPVYIPPPPPPQRMVVVTQPEVTYTTTTYQYQYAGFTGRQTVGLGAWAGGLAMGSRESERGAGMGGVGGSLRFRYAPHFATELTLGVMGGTDYNGDNRAEFPVTVNQLFYLNPQNRLQVYGLLGLGASWAGVGYDDSLSTRRGDSASYAYFGAQVGVGLEWQITRHISLFGDARAFIRTRVDAEASSNPEFTRIHDGVRQTSNTSVGLLGSGGVMFYF